MNGFIQFIQAILSTIEDVDVSSSYPNQLPPDTTIVSHREEKSKIQKQSNGSSPKSTYRYNTFVDVWGDNLSTTDEKSNEIETLLKTYNFDTSVKDLGIDNNKRRFQVQGTVIWNELTEKLHNQ